MIINHDDDANQDCKQDSDLHHYFSNGDDQTKKPWEEKDFVDYDMAKYEDEEPLSINDLIIQAPKEKVEEEAVTPQFSQVEEVKEYVQEEQEKPAFHEQFFWKVNLINNE